MNPVIVFALYGFLKPVTWNSIKLPVWSDETGLETVRILSLKEQLMSGLILVTGLHTGFPEIEGSPVFKSHNGKVTWIFPLSIARSVFFGVNDIFTATPVWPMTLDNGVIEAVNSLSGEKPEIVVYVKIARVIVPDIRTVLTPTILETELGFLKELILKKIAYTDLVVERLIVATCEVREQLDMVTPDVV